MKVSTIALFVVSILLAGSFELQASREHNKQHHNQVSKVEKVGSHCKSRPWDPKCR